MKAPSGAWAVHAALSDQLAVEDQLRDQLSALTGQAVEIIADGDIHKIDHPDSSRGNKRIWYACHPEYAVWSDFADGEKRVVFAKGPYDPEKAERARQDAERRQRERRLERARENAQAAVDAQDALRRLPWADPFHPYLVKKRIDPFSLRQEGPYLVAFLTDGHGVVGYQRIPPVGKKLFLKGTPAAGAYWPLGHVYGCIAVCEGVATAIAIHQGYGYAVAAAMSADNLKPVCLSLRERHPDTPIIVMADNDHGESMDKAEQDNAGIRCGKQAAQAVGGRCVWPAARSGHKSTDYADLWLECPWYFDQEVTV